MAKIKMRWTKWYPHIDCLGQRWMMRNGIAPGHIETECKSVPPTQKKPKPTKKQEGI